MKRATTLSLLFFIIYSAYPFPKNTSKKICDTLPQVDTCNQITFKKIYKAPGDQESFDVVEFDNNYHFIAGRSNTSATMDDALLMKVNKQGDLNNISFTIESACNASTICNTHVSVDSCSLKSFQNIYSGQGNYEVFSIEKTKDQGSILCGRINPVPNDPVNASPNFDALLIKLYIDGSVQWAKKIGGNQYEEFRAVRETKSGNFIAIGCTSSFSTYRGIYVVETDQNGNILWSNNFSANAPLNDLGLQIAELSDNSIVITGVNNANPPFARGIAIRLDGGGNIIWNKSFYTNQGINLRSTVEVGSSLYISGDLWSNAGNRFYGAILKLNTLDGNPQAAKQILIDTRSNFDVRLFKTSYGFAVSTHIIDQSSYAQKQQGILKLDNNLNFISGGKFSIIDPSFWSSSYPTSDGGFIASASDASNGGFYLYKLDNNFSIQWQNKYGNSLANVTNQASADVKQTDSGDYISASTFRTSSSSIDGKILVIKSLGTGETPDCTVLPSNVTFTQLPADITDLTLTENSSMNFNTPFSVVSPVSDLNIAKQALCKTSFDLGPDLSVCIHDTLLITAPSGFTNYIWTPDYNINNTTNQNVRVWPLIDTNYYVTAEKFAGCRVSDSIHVSVKVSPPIDLGPDRNICENDSAIISAPPGFAKYKWNTGDTVSQIVVKNNGIYSLNATAPNGCSSADTVEVTKLALPQNFLDTSAEVCPSEKITLTAKGNYQKYKWSTGAVTSSSEFTGAGLYWLEVTNSDGCTNREYIDVKEKSCKQSINFPNAFSPTHARNNRFKPIISGNLGKYRFFIYNRWGEKIFETSDPLASWNGIYKGKMQDSNTFVWYCSYQFAGDIERIAKGTVTLLK